MKTKLWLLLMCALLVFSSAAGAEAANAPTVLNVSGVSWRDGQAYFSLSYRLGEEGETQRGYMDAQGMIVAELPSTRYENGNASFTLYDADGNVVYESAAAYSQVECAQDGVYLVQEVRSGLDESATYAGLMDENGAWLFDGPVNVSALTGETLLQSGRSAALGEGMFSVYAAGDGNCLVVFDGETGAYFAVPDVWNHGLHYRNGAMILQRWDGGTGGGQMGAICSVNRAGEITELPAEGNLLCEGENGFLTDANNLSFYDRAGNLLWTFDRYELTDAVEPFFYEDVVVAHVRGADGNSYAACLSQQSGELLYTPFMDANGFIDGHYVLRGDGERNVVTDLLSGENVAELDVDFSADEVEYYGSGLYVLHPRVDGESTYRFFTPQGEEIIPTLG